MSQPLLEKHSALHEHCTTSKKYTQVCLIIPLIGYVDSYKTWFHLRASRWFIYSEGAYLQHTTLIKPVD